MQSNDFDEYKSGADLLAAFNYNSREKKLAQACIALMEELNAHHIKTHNMCLRDNLTNRDVFCSCADAYRMGYEALKED